VRAADADAAIKVAIEAFGIDEPQRQRRLAAQPPPHLPLREKPASSDAMTSRRTERRPAMAPQPGYPTFHGR